MGLFITKAPVERHGGTCRFEAPRDKGTTVRTMLPLESPLPR
jgi:signal transduction histidine kinase